MRVSSRPVLIDPGITPAMKKLYNDGPGTVYYKSTEFVSSTSNDGSVAAGAMIILPVPKWFATAVGSGASVRVEDRGATVRETVTLTQAEYDALGTYDPRVLYVIFG